MRFVTTVAKEVTMKRAFLPFLLMVFAPAVAFAGGPDFFACKSTYALCTTAACTPIPGKTDVVSCQCNVETDYSAGLKPCNERKLSKA